MDRTMSDMHPVVNEGDNHDRQSIVESEATPTTATTDQVLISALLEDRRAMQANLNMLMRLVEWSHTSGAESVRVSSHGEPKPTKFAEATNDIEAFLTTFEWLMTAHHVDTTQWAYSTFWPHS